MRSTTDASARTEWHSLSGAGLRGGQAAGLAVWRDDA